MNKNPLLAILMALAFMFNASATFAADYEPEWPIWDEEKSYFPPATSENFNWQGHNPADEGWYEEEGDLDQATLIHWADNGLTPLSFGGHILKITPDGDDATIIAKEFIGNAGDWLVIDWARVFEDYPPYMDVVFGYKTGENGVTTTLFSAIMTDGSSDWLQSWTYLETSEVFTVYLGAMNGIDGAVDPELLIGGINIVTFSGEKGLGDISPAPVPVPGAVWLLGSALAGMVSIRRRKTA